MNELLWIFGRLPVDTVDYTKGEGVVWVASAIVFYMDGGHDIVAGTAKRPNMKFNKLPYRKLSTYL